MSFVDRFHAGFNYQFEKITNKYKGGVKWVINHGIIAGSLVAVSIVGLVALMGTTKTGLVPDASTHLYDYRHALLCNGLLLFANDSNISAS